MCKEERYLDDSIIINFEFFFMVRVYVFISDLMKVCVINIKEYVVWMLISIKIMKLMLLSFFVFI